LSPIFLPDVLCNFTTQTGRGFCSSLLSLFGRQLLQKESRRAI
jgi:hypothetical protein